MSIFKKEVIEKIQKDYPDFYERIKKEVEIEARKKRTIKPQVNQPKGKTINDEVDIIIYYKWRV